MKGVISTILFLFYSCVLLANDGHQLWLQTKNAVPVNIVCARKSPVITIAKEELRQGWQGRKDAVVSLVVKNDNSLRHDGFKLTGNSITASTDLGILYGVYALLRLQHTNQSIHETTSNPSYELRILNHWDNLDGSIERGYAGLSIFWRAQDPFTTTENDLSRWVEYARANASIGINGAVLNNVNASHKILSTEYLQRAKAIANVLRPYGIKIYLSVKFSTPALLGNLKTSDPLDPTVKKWWQEKTDEIYKQIPDFGGFLIKANSEGQPGPQDYGRTHADGANMLADALKSHGGIVMWRAFVYNPLEKDRARQAHLEFVPLDGHFRDNVILQVKNGPVDFQPREPFNPLFGAITKTALMPEFQVTQEYLGQSAHLVFLSPMWEECLRSETYSDGMGSTVARCTDGSIYPQAHTAIAGVSNIGSDTNWCGHHFAQANWYAFGRLSWDSALRSDQIADEWIRLTFYPYTKPEVISSTEWTTNFLNPVKHVMLESREAAVSYMMPVGLHHLFSANEHYGPGPWWAPKKVRPDWTPPYYHQADSIGVGFDRTRTGSNAVSQYHEPLASQFNDPITCPEIYLLWFHHLPWTYTMRSGRTLWNEICHRYEDGVAQVEHFQQIWDQTEPYVDAERFTAVQHKLRIQVRDAVLWKDACLLYFQQKNHLPIPYEIRRPVNDLEDIMAKDAKRLGQ